METMPLNFNQRQDAVLYFFTFFFPSRAELTHCFVESPHLGGGGVVMPSHGVARKENEFVRHECRTVLWHDAEISHRSLSRVGGWREGNKVFNEG